MQVDTNRVKKQRTGGRKEKSCGIKKTKNGGKSENKEERVIRVKWDWKEDGGVPNRKRSSSRLYIVTLFL